MQKEGQIQSPITFVLNRGFTLDDVQSGTLSKQNSGNIYFGGITALTNSIMTTNKIAAVLTVMTNKQKRKAKLDERLDDSDCITKHSNLTVYDDSQSIEPYFNGAASFIQESVDHEMNVLVHCQSGNSRSAAIIAAYLIHKYKIKTQQAIAILKKKRQTIDFHEQLKQDLHDYEGKIANLTENNEDA